MEKLRKKKKKKNEKSGVEAHARILGNGWSRSDARSAQSIALTRPPLAALERGGAELSLEPKQCSENAKLAELRPKDGESAHFQVG